MTDRTAESRIEGRVRALDVLAHVAHKLKHQRLGQIISNALPDSYARDPFYVEDEALVDLLLRYYERNPEPR